MNRRVFGVQLAAAALAAGGQTLVEVLPAASVGLFVCAVLFVLFSERERAVEDAPAPGSPVRSRIGVMLLGIGWALCIGAGIVLARPGLRSTTHAVWLAGLASLLAAAAIWWWRERRTRASTRPLLDPRIAVAYAFLVLLVVFLFGWNLTGIPMEVHGDDAEVGNDAIELLSPPFDLFRSGWYGLPILHAGPTAIALWLAGIDLWALRAASAVLGAATVLLLFGFVRRLWDLPTALLAAVLLAATPFFVHISRAGFHYVDTPFVAVLVLWLFVRIWSEGRISAAVLCGVALGLGVQTYPASRVIPVLLTLTWFLWCVTDRRQWKTQLLLWVVVAGTALAVATPIGVYFAEAPRELWYRVRETSIFTEDAQKHLMHGYRTDSFVRIVLIQLRAALTLFNATEDTSVQFGMNGPLLDPVAGVLFVLGVAAAVARPLRPRQSLLLVWLVVPLIAGAALTIDTPFYPRISGTVPFAALAAALGARTLLTSLFAASALAARSRRAVTALAGVAIAVATLTFTVRRYFLDYAIFYRHSPALEIVQFIRRYDQGDKITYFIPGMPDFSARHGVVKFLAHGHRTVDIEDPKRLAGAERDRALFIVMDRVKDVIPEIERRFGPLQVEYHDEGSPFVTFHAVRPLPESGR